MTLAEAARAGEPVDWEAELGTDALDRLWVRRDREPSTRLEQERRRRYSAAAARCFAETGAPMVQFHEVRVVRGWTYMAAPPADPDEVARRQATHREEAERYLDEGTGYYKAVIEPQALAVLTDLRRRRGRSTRLPALVQHLERCLDADALVMGDLHWRMAGASRHDFPEVFAETTGEPPVAANTLLQAVDNRTTRMVRRLRELARIVQDDPVLREVAEQGAWHRLGEPDVAPRPAARRLERRLGALLRRYGRRTGAGYGSTAGLRTPTWSMRPQTVLDVVAGYARADLDDLERREQAARADRQRALRRHRRALRHDPEALERFERARRAAVLGVISMEDHNHLMEQETMGTLREAVWAVGRRLVDDGHLDDPDDVFHLEVGELHQLAGGGHGTTPRALVAERRAELAANAELDPPRTIGRGELPERFAPPAEPGATDEGIVRGASAMGGTATGRAVVVADSPVPPAVRPGDVLVARDAGPAWTPVFQLLGGLVLDQGQTWQHAALVAREYGIPTVVQTGHATTAVPDGATVVVDGDEGSVRVVT